MKKKTKKKGAKLELGYCPFELKHWVTIQSLYRDTKAGLAWGRLKLYRDRRGCIVTER